MRLLFFVTAVALASAGDAAPDKATAAAEKRLGSFVVPPGAGPALAKANASTLAMLQERAEPGLSGSPQYNTGGTVLPLTPFKDEIPQVAKEFYRSLDAEYITSAKKVIAEIDCCHPDSAGGKNGLQMELICPHAYPNVPFSFTNQTTGKTIRNPSDCTCKMSAAKSKARFETSSAALVGFYRQMSYELDQEGSFQAGMAAALKNFAKASNGALLETKVMGKNIPCTSAAGNCDLDETAMLIETDWSKIGKDDSSLLEMSQKHLMKYIPSEQPGVEWLRDLRAMEKTYKATRDLHLRAYKRVILANRPFMASAEAYVQVVKRYNGEVRRMMEAHLTMSLKGGTSTLVREGWAGEHPGYEGEDGYGHFLEYLFERYSIQEGTDLDSMVGTRESEIDGEGVPQRAFHQQNANNQDKDGEYESMEDDFANVYKMMRNKFLRCAIDLREVIPAIEATFSALLPLDFGAPLLEEYQYLGPGWCLKERGAPTYDDSEDARERGYTGDIDKYYNRPDTVTSVKAREECEDACTNLHKSIVQTEGEFNEYEGVSFFEKVPYTKGDPAVVQAGCNRFCEEAKDAGCTGAFVPKVHNDSPEGKPILEAGTANPYDVYFLDAKNMEDCKQYCYGTYRATKGPHKGKIITQHGCYCQQSWTTRYDKGDGGLESAQIYNPEGDYEMGNEGIKMCSEMGNHAEGREWCKVEPNCEAFKGEQASEGGKLRKIHTDITDGGKYGTTEDVFEWSDNEYSGQWDYCVKFSEPAFQDSYGNNLCQGGDDWGSYHLPAGASPNGEDGEQPSEAEFNSWHGVVTTTADDWEGCQDICDKIGTYPVGDEKWVFPRLRCSNFYFTKDMPGKPECRIELSGPNCKINLWNCQTFESGCNGYEYNSEYQLCRIFGSDNGRYHKDSNLPGFGRPGSSEGIHEVLTWDGMDCTGSPQTFVPRGFAKDLEDYKDPWVKAIWFPQTCAYDDQAREDYASMYLDQDVGAGPSCSLCKYEIPLGPQTDNYFDPYVKEYKDVIENEIRRYEGGENPYFVHPHAEFEREFFKWECWRRESVAWKKDLWFDKLETGYHVWEWPGQAKHDSQELDEVVQAQDNELYNDVNEYKAEIAEHDKVIDEKVDKYEECVNVDAPELSDQSIKPYLPALSTGVQDGHVRPSALVDFDKFYDNLCEMSGVGDYDCDGISICDLASEIEIEYGLRNELKHVMSAAQKQLAAGSQARYVDHQEAWIKPKLREAYEAMDCINKATGEYETAARSYVAFLKSESEIAAFSKERWYNRVKDLIEKWNGVNGGGAVLEQQAMHRVHASYQAVHAQIESSMRKGSLSETATKLRAAQTKVDIDFSKPLPLMDDQKKANEISLLQMTKRIDENAFRIVDFAAVYIESRDAHVKAINDLVLSMGPYLTALKAYSVALKSYADAAEEKAKHILKMRDLDRVQRTVNDARAIVAFNDLKGGTKQKAHVFFSEEDPRGEGNYAAAYYKQREQEAYMLSAYNEDIKKGHYQVLDNKLDSGKKDLYYAFAPYFIPFPPEHWMMKLSMEQDDSIMVDLVERDYETNKAKYLECTASIQKHSQAFRKALNAAQVMPAGL